MSTGLGTAYSAHIGYYYYYLCYKPTIVLNFEKNLEKHTAIDSNLKVRLHTPILAPSQTRTQGRGRACHRPSHLHGPTEISKTMDAKENSLHNQSQRASLRINNQ